MATRILTSPQDLEMYGAWIRSHPDGTLWQSSEWKRFQEALGRQVRIYADVDGDQVRSSALVVIDRTSGGLSTWEIPRGPLGDGKILEQITQNAKKERSLALYYSPPITQLATRNSGRHVMPEATRMLDLTLSDDDLLAQMKPKGRYNIRLAEKHGVQIAQSDDVGAYTRLGEETARRDSFRGHKEAFYQHFLRSLPGSFLMIAMTAQKTPIAGLLGVVWGTQGIYYYGASSNAHRELMAPYLLQWEAMRHCRSRSCTSYDLFGIAPEGKSDHPWASVSEFKAKFGGSVITYPPEQEITLRPAMKTMLKLKRKLVG